MFVWFAVCVYSSDVGLMVFFRFVPLTIMTSATTTKVTTNHEGG